MKITEDMVQEFNNLLFDFGCIFKLEIVKDGNNSNNPFYQIVPMNNFFIESIIINPSKEFYVLLENFFSKNEITLNYNNTKTIFCSKYGFNE